MGQSPSERVEALISVLPKLTEHLHVHAAITSALSHVVPGDDEEEPFCGCGQAYCPKCDELWHALEESNMGRWRLRSVAFALIRLHRTAPHLAKAVWHEYVELWPEWNPKDRERWADDGLLFMVEDIPGEIPYCEAEAGPPRETERDREILRLRDIEGLSYHAISKQVGCSKSTVHALLHGNCVRHGRSVSADSLTRGK